MVVLAARDGTGEEDAGGVDGLEDAAEVGASGDFLDEEGGEASRTELLVDAEEVDLSAALCPVSGRKLVGPRGSRTGHVHISDVDVHGDSGDEGDELASCCDTDSDVPVWHVPGWSQGPGGKEKHMRRGSQRRAGGTHHWMKSAE